MSNPAVFDDSNKDDEDFILSDQCDDYVPEIKKEKYEKKPESSNNDMPMPERYCHIRTRQRKVHEEMYTVMHLLSSKYRMSKQQIEKSIITVANMLFDREWKLYKTKGNTDLNTLPSMKNLINTELLFEAMALNAIVEEMMDENIQASIPFSNDRSS